MTSVFEEIKRNSKSYPPNHVARNLPANRYIEYLVGAVGQKLAARLFELQEQDRFPDMLELVQRLLSDLDDSSSQFALPLESILYSERETMLPAYPDRLALTTLILNRKEVHQNFFKSLKFELETTDDFDFIVSFIRMSGLQLLVSPLKTFSQRVANGPEEGQGRKARILTSTYMTVTEPKALRQLLEFEHIDTRVYAGSEVSFHTKAYLFSRRSGLNTAIIGSSNLSSAALREGQEWNLRVPDGPHSSVYKDAKDQFELLWNHPLSMPLTPRFVDEYEAHFKAHQSAGSFRTTFVPDLLDDGNNNPLSDGVDGLGLAKTFRAVSAYDTSASGLVPNAMQQRALDGLEQTRASGAERAAVIAATGSGKTFLAAFDVQRFKPQRMLFLAHRKELLDNACKTFNKLYQARPGQLCGMLTGESKTYDTPFIFASVQTLARPEQLARFKPDHFDYVIVDEFHHASASTYQRILDHFKPNFLLGLTATPERMDGRDVLAICDHNVAFELRLRGALELELLAPFHYFGVADDTVDYDDVDVRGGMYVERSLVEHLNTMARVEYILRNIRLYGHHGEHLCALGFCVNVEHADFMAAAFERRGRKALSLHGGHTGDERLKAILRLQDPNDPLEVIFTVNIFNEGVDIPQLNMLLFLRPTQSSTVFIQQLGRGLRKVEGKEYVTVLDFIGNYRNSFVVPLALAGETASSFDKESLKDKVEAEFSDLPGECYVDLDAVTKQRIIQKLDAIRVNSAEWLKLLYHQFKRDLGSSPTILDFLYTQGAPNFSAFARKYGSLMKAKRRFKDLTDNEALFLDDGLMSETVERLENMLPLKWPYEYAILDHVLEANSRLVTVDDVLVRLQQWFSLEVHRAHHESLIQRAMAELAIPYKKHGWAFGQVADGAFEVDEQHLHLLGDAQRRAYLKTRLIYGMTHFRRHFQPRHFLGGQQRLAHYQNYTREDLQFLFEDTAKKGSWREGVKRLGQRYLLFINLHKSEETKEELKYQDFFIDPVTFHWQSQNATSHSSNTGQNFVHHKMRGYEILLFVRKYAKMHGETLPFMYLGKVDYVRSHGDKPMTIIWKLHDRIPDKIFADFSR